MPPPVVGLTRPAASPTASSRVAIGARDGPSGRILSRGSRHGVRRRSNRARVRSANVAEEPLRARLAHQAEPRVRLAVTLERNQPGEAARRHGATEVDFDIGGALDRLLELGTLHEAAWNAESELAVETIVRATGEHAGAGAKRGPSSMPIVTPLSSMSTVRTRVPLLSSAPAARPTRRAPGRNARDRPPRPGRDRNPPPRRCRRPR